MQISEDQNSVEEIIREIREMELKHNLNVDDRDQENGPQENVHGILGVLMSQ